MFFFPRVNALSEFLQNYVYVYLVIIICDISMYINVPNIGIYIYIYNIIYMNICVFAYWNYLCIYIRTAFVCVCVCLFFYGHPQKPRLGAAGGCAATWLLCSFGGHLVGGFMGFVKKISIYIYIYI